MLNEECETLKKSDQSNETEKQLEQVHKQWDETLNRLKLVSHKYQLSKRLIPALQNQIAYQKEIGEKLKNEIAVLVNKVDGNKKDSIKNKKVKEILAFLDDRVSNLIKDSTVMQTDSKQEPVTNTDEKRVANEDKDQMPPPPPLLTKSSRAFKPIELPSDDQQAVEGGVRRTMGALKSLNLTNKENIV
ncbi:hypothetical protein BLA29_009821 [Euroglyphus maynei]|uniref:Uncharacterized protein n=1 Tax=Euroglyphus maynei TaxID=6958 RepID=A0A1Y3BE52_EURMA|nr:hypothetical protein BLA29_009821 [Euroglyphus maynei]